MPYIILFQKRIYSKKKHSQNDEVNIYKNKGEYISIPPTKEIPEEGFRWMSNDEWDASVPQKTYFFLAGLPRAGGTLLGAILNQNPDIYVGPTSPIL